MFTGRTVFAQLVDLLPLHEFRKCIARYRGEHKVLSFSCLDQLLLEPGAFYIFDRGYLDFARLYAFTQSAAFFITRAKSNTQFQRRYSSPVDKSTGLRSDQTVILTGVTSVTDYPAPLRRIHYVDAEHHNDLVFLTNHFALPAATIAQLYRARWRVELFFRWIKQHLRLKAFYGTSENAVKTQIWTAISVYVLVAILKKQVGLDLSLYTILQILNLTLFEKIPISQIFTNVPSELLESNCAIQLELFNL